MKFTTEDVSGSFENTDGVNVTSNKSLSNVRINGIDNQITAKDFNELAQDVANWLNTNDYDSTADVFTHEKQTGDIDTLIAKYTTFSDNHFNI